MMSSDMARSATTSDAFNAVAEPRRRMILEVLAGGEMPVNDVATALRMSQPQASKHLKVLKEVGLVDVRQDGRRRLYCLNAGSLQPIHRWVTGFERFWTESFERLDSYLAQIQQKGER